MNRKPWPIVILGLMQIIVPIFGVLLSAYLYNMTPFRYLRVYFEIMPAVKIFEFLFLFPIAGIAILAMRRWSYPFFIIAMLWATYSNIQTSVLDYQSNWGVVYIIGITLVNFAVVTYFLLPSVRRFYFDERVRWWESKPRFKVEIMGVIEYDGLA